MVITSANSEQLPRRKPGTQLPHQSDRPTRFVGRALVEPGGCRWSTDSATLLRLRDALLTA